MVQSMNQTALIFALLRNEAVLTLSSQDEILVHNESGSDQRVDLSAPPRPYLLYRVFRVLSWEGIGIPQKCSAPGTRHGPGSD